MVDEEKSKGEQRKILATKVVTFVTVFVVVAGAVSFFIFTTIK